MANVYKRGNVWWGRVQVRGKDLRQSLETTSKSVADKRLREWLNRLEAHQWGDKPRRTYDEAMESFLLKHCPTLKPSSVYRYRSSARILTPEFEGKYLDQITSATLADYEAKRRADGVSAPTIRRDLSCLSSMFTHAIVDLEWLDVNPVPTFLKRQKRRGRLQENDPRTRYLSHDEETALLAAVENDFRGQIAFAIDTGLRREEQWGLTWDRVSLARQEIRIPKELAKGKKERVVPILPRSAQFLAHLPRHLRIDGGPDWVFNKKDSTRYDRRNKGLTAATNRADLKDLVWHDLRRTCGCRLIQDKGMPLEEVRDWLGHESVQQTERAYAFLKAEQLHKRVGTKTGTGRKDSNSGGPPDDE